MKKDVDLFARLYIVAQNRESDLAAFFMHENSECPPALSDQGRLRQGTKSDLLQCLVKTVNTEGSTSSPGSDVPADPCQTDPALLTAKLIMIPVFCAFVCVFFSFVCNLFYFPLSKISIFALISFYVDS
jgi:hypothetical protein